MGDEKQNPQKTERLTRRNFLTVGTTSLAVAGISLGVYGQTRDGAEKAEHNHSSSDPGPVDWPPANGQRPEGTGLDAGLCVESPRKAA